MRVTAEKSLETRQRLLAVAGELFCERGFGKTTTRDIALRAKLASGTLFNYFRSKEELALALVVARLAEANAEFETLRRPAGTLDEWLYALVSTELRHLAPMRPYLLDILNGVLHPFAADGTSAGAVRREHLARVYAILDHFNMAGNLSSTGWTHLYWSLYLGVLAHWSADPSPNQDATMALLDNAIFMFVGLLRVSPDNLKVWG